MCVTSVSNSYDMIVALRKMLDREIEVVSPDPSNLFFNFLDYELFFGKKETITIEINNTTSVKEPNSGINCEL